jgi:hypothetical protein
MLLAAEQGIGDQIQMVRYAGPLKAMGASRIIVECDPKLVDLFQHGCEGLDFVIPRGSSRPDHDLAIPLMSLPLALGTELSTIPVSSYLRADQQRVIQFEPAVEQALQLPNPRKRIGFVWAGSPFNTQDHNRSCPLPEFQRLIHVPDTVWFSLQVDLRPGEAEQLEDLGAYDLEAAVADSFAITAAVLERLDLIVAVDSAVVHLAGAMGKLVLVALPFDPDWRWLHTGDRTPWYPSARLFRQRTRGDWPGVLQDIRDWLEDWIQSGAA